MSSGRRIQQKSNRHEGVTDVQDEHQSLSPGSITSPTAETDEIQAAGQRKSTACSCARRPYRPVHFDRLVHWHSGRRDRFGFTHGRTRSFLRRPGARHLLRKPIGKRATKKRQTPAPIPPRLLAHMRRWKKRKLIASHFVEFNGKRVASVKKGFRSAVGLAGLSGKVTPDTLRHTDAT
jgi:hypothetical protein